VEQIPRQQYHVNILVFCDTHDFVKAPPAIIASNGVSLCIADMTVRRDEYTDGVCGLICRSAKFSGPVVGVKGERNSSIDVAITWEARHNGLATVFAIGEDQMWED